MIEVFGEVINYGKNRYLYISDSSWPGYVYVVYSEPLKFFRIRSPELRCLVDQMKIKVCPIEVVLDYIKDNITEELIEIPSGYNYNRKACYDKLMDIIDQIIVKSMYELG